MNLSLDDLAHVAIRVKHGPGREEYLADRSRALRDDAREQIGMLILSPIVAERADGEVEGRVIEREGRRYRVIVDEHLKGAKTEDGDDVAGYWLDAPARPVVDWTLNHAFRLEWYR